MEDVYKRQTIELIAYIESHGNIVFLPKEDIMGKKDSPLNMEVKVCLNRALSDEANFNLCISEIKSMINKNMFLFENFDEYYITNRDCYKKRHYIHNFLINGYDDENFYVWGYTDRLKFEKVLVPYRNVYEALMAITYKDRQRFICVNLEFDYNFDSNQIKLGLINYISGNSAYDFGNGTQCGIDFVKFIINDLKNDLQYFDFRYYRTIKEHKQAMCDRIEWIYQQMSIYDGDVLTMSREICKYANLAFLSLLKYSKTKCLVDKDNAIKILNKMVNLEQECYTRLIELL